ncbi:hypothetical protein L9F63_025283 [Diploptera punctata]|uniref:Ionotropic glutamate receptor C-terminal domain-containing protein n=1 Tax=Diploptera punctata TaxID=6984 RepID=A0AAD8E5S2_DIPPU|nr:hypothetical protein L9F63_025283 [Diploptera punctata]
MSEAINASLDLKMAPPGGWGMKYKNGTYTGMLGAVYNNDANVSFTNSLLSEDRVEDFDFISPVRTVRLIWVVPCPNKYSMWTNFIKVFNAEAWATILLSLGIGSFIMLLLSRKTISEKITLYDSISSCFCSFWAVILGISVAAQPNSNSSRIFFIAWVWYSLAINTVFQTYTTSFMTEPAFEKPITNVEEMVKSGYGAKLHKSQIDFIAQEGLGNIIQRNEYCQDMTSCAYGVMSERKYVTIVPGCVTDLINFGQEKSLLCIISEPYKLSPEFFYLRKGSPYLQNFNKLWKMVFEIGLHIKFLKDAITFNSKSILDFKEDLVIEESYAPISLATLEGAFYLFLCGHGISIVILTMEIIYFNKKLKSLHIK